MLRYLIIVYFGILSCLLTVSCTKSSTPATAPVPSAQTLVSNLQNNYSFSLFYYALKKTGLDKLVSGATPYTLLIPDNNAFAKDSIFKNSDLDKMDTAALRSWISYHILPGSIVTEGIAQAVNNPYLSISGQTLFFSRPVPGTNQKQTDIDHILHINGDTVNTVDVIASNGVIQILNAPLKLPVSSVQAYLAGNVQYSFLVSALQHFGLWDQLTGPGPFTIFAPDSASFTAIGITRDSLNHLDTTFYKTSLFGIYVLTPARVFLSDFYDIGLPTVYGQTAGNFYTSNGTYFWTQQEIPHGSLANMVSVYEVYYTTWTDPDVIAVNGVVQGIHGLLQLPKQAKK